MYYGLFLIYFICCCYFIPRIPFIKKSGLGSRVIIGLFILKVLAGLFIGWMSERYYSQGNDYWMLNWRGWEEYKILVTSPGQFLTNIFSTYYSEYGSFFGSTQSYWNDLENNIIIKLLAVLNIFSQGNYYINSLFVNVIGFTGHVALYRVFIHIFSGKKWPVMTGCFLLPSTLYFVSGLNKDLFVFTLLSLFCYAMYFTLQNGYSLRKLIVIILSFLLLLFIRNFVALFLVPPLIGWILHKKYNIGKVKAFSIPYVVSIFLLFVVQFLQPALNPAKIISQKQLDFLSLPAASTQFVTEPIQPTFSGLIQHAPTAINHAFFRPYAWEYPGKFIFILGLELLMYQLLFAWFLISRRKFIASNSFVPFTIILSISLLILSGYIATNAGTMVRYRSLYLPFLITPILVGIQLRKQAH